MVRLGECRRLGDDVNGGAAIEFAIVGPMFVVLLFGILSFGGWFWMGHSVQQLANDAARAAVGGLDVAERESLARTAVEQSISGQPFLSWDRTRVAVESTSGGYRVVVTADASRSPFVAMGALLPSPPSSVEREAAIRLGGY